MSYKITGKDIRKQLAGHYGSYIAVLLIIYVILGFCTVFCGTQLEWKHPLSIILERVHIKMASRIMARETTEK